MAQSRTVVLSGIADRLREAALFVFLALAVYLLIALSTFNPTDSGWSYTGSDEQVRNAGGWLGAWFADFALYLLGYPAYLLPPLVLSIGVLVYRGPAAGSSSGTWLIVRWLGLLILLAAACGLASIHFNPLADNLPVGTQDAGGVVGQSLSTVLVDLGDVLGATLALLAVLLGAVTLFTGISWFQIMDLVGALTLNGFRWLATRLTASAEPRPAKATPSPVPRADKSKYRKSNPLPTARVSPRIEPVIGDLNSGARAQREKQIELFEVSPGQQLPALSLLDVPQARAQAYSDEALQALSRLLELKLADFGVAVEVVEVHPGPVITRFELQTAAGVKVSQITNLAKDLARSMSVISVRVVEVIPGKSTVGIEIPNEERELVQLSDLLGSDDYDRASSPLSLALGKDIGGQPVIADLSRMPHILVAGTTGAGKSVAISAMLLSLLFKAGSDQVRMILIDPKMLELNIYEGIPHLLTPVVTDMKEAANALRWAVGEMDRRYRLMAAVGVRNIAGFNKKIGDANKAGQPLPDPLFQPDAANLSSARPNLEPLPYIVIVVDELADLIMVVGKKIEELIARLAQKARAAGVHLVLATQRPSVDVITGLIKANIPCRMAFQVSARTDSRTILDQMGAEQLLGHGDMLYLPPGTGHPMRVHGAFVSDAEIHRVADDLRSRGQAHYIEAILQDSVTAEGAGPGADSAEADALFDDAVAIVTESRKASISYLQRRLKIGYNRAARMIEAMELAGVVSEVQSNGSREVLAPPPPED